ncbi:MAG: hypothetical protein WCO57_06430 [Verrucomicrobiota bacterium]
MSDTQDPPQDDNRPAPKPARRFPDIASCRAKRSFGEYVECLVPSPGCCDYALSFGYCYLCLHPQHAEIIAHTEASL